MVVTTNATPFYKRQFLSAKNETSWQYAASNFISIPIAISELDIGGD